jgi:hypothetical protein
VGAHQTFCKKMRAALILTLIGALTVGCEQQPKVDDSNNTAPASPKSEKPMIRSIGFNGDKEDFGIQLNGKHAFLRIETKPRKRIEIPYDEGLRLLETFYGISGIEEYRGKKSDDRQTSIHYLVDIHDEMPARYSEEWVDYVIPKDKVPLHPEINKWFQAMNAAKTSAEQAGTGQPATRPELKSEGSDKPQPDAEGRSR